MSTSQLTLKPVVPVVSRTESVCSMKGWKEKRRRQEKQRQEAKVRLQKFPKFKTLHGFINYQLSESVSAAPPQKHWLTPNIKCNMTA